MGSINRSHNEADGGILLFQGELILLYCDSVSCEIGGRESFKGRVYLTTHRLVVIVTPYRQNATVKSLCAPFCAIAKCSVEQPIFGANYIEATVRDETDSSKSFSFKLKFSKGGAIEMSLAMNRAVAAVGRNFNPSMPPPPAYNPAPSAQYYQAPPTVYQPGFNSGIQVPVQTFPDQPPIGFIYTSSAPPPYPGLGPQGGSAGGGQAPPSYQSGYPSSGNQPSSGGPGPGYPTQPQGGGYPGSQNYPTQPPQGGFPAGQNYPTQQPQGPYPQQPTAGYPQHQPPAGYPQQPSQPQQQPQAPESSYPMGQQNVYGSGYPQPPPTSGYPGNQPPQGSYPQAPSNPGAGYPNLPQESSGQSAWPSAPAYNPNWSDDKKSA